MDTGKDWSEMNIISETFRKMYRREIEDAKKRMFLFQEKLMFVPYYHMETILDDYDEIAKSRNAWKRVAESAMKKWVIEKNAGYGKTAFACFYCESEQVYLDGKWSDVHSPDCPIEQSRDLQRSGG